MKVVYITGCLGFIGSYITKQCLDLGWQVMGVDKCTYAANLSLIDEFKKFKNFTFLNEDINNLKFLYDCDYVINTAAETHVGNSIIESEEFLKTNVDGVANLLNIIRNCRTESSNKPILFHLSTDEVYGDIENGFADENSALKPSNPYSATKASADMLIMAWSRTYNIPYIILRPTNNYGDGQYVEKLIPKCCKYFQIEKKLPLHNQGKSIRTWLHASDTSNAVIHLIQLGIKNEIFNVSSHCEKENLEVCNSLAEYYFGTNYSTDELYDFSYQRPGQDLRYALNDDKLRNLGWKEQAIFEKEILKIGKYYKNRFIW